LSPAAQASSTLTASLCCKLNANFKNTATAENINHFKAFLDWRKIFAETRCLKYLHGEILMFIYFTYLFSDPKFHYFSRSERNQYF